MKISIFGMGYVGAVSMACLARDDHHVIGVDVDPAKLEMIRQGRSPIIEEGISELMARVVKERRVEVTDDAAAAVAGSCLSFVCVGTPSASNGSQDLTAIKRLAEQLGAALAHKPDYHVVVMRSTVEPGTTEGVFTEIIERSSGKKAGVDFGLGFQPEFLREGSSIRDYDAPPFTIIGAADARTIAAIRELFGHLDCDFIETGIRVAETMKMACNAFHALKITFANEIGRFSQGMDIDARQVMGLVCRDTRLNISPAYLRPGFAFGGSCLPKDVRALLYLARQNDVTLPMLGSLLPSNRAHVDHVLEQILSSGKRRVGLLGLSFKTGTDDLRESPLVTLAERLIGKGIKLKIYDPEVNLSRLLGANKRYIDEVIPHIGSLMCASVDTMLEGNDVVVVGLQRQDLIDRVAQYLKPQHLLIDLVGIRNRSAVSAQYRGACW